MVLDEKKRDIKLTDNQESAVNEIIYSRDSKFLLYGVTGSGKTEVYIELLKRTINEGKTGIVLVPEISLTPQIVSRFKSVFGSSVAVFHSSLSEGEKYDEYRRIMNHEVSLVVGARSAIFTPLKNIGIIILFLLLYLSVLFNLGTKAPILTCLFIIMYFALYILINLIKKNK